MKHPDVWKAVGEPTSFMDAKFRYAVRYFATERRARAWGRCYVALHPHGKVDLFHGKRRAIRRAQAGSLQ